MPQLNFGEIDDAEDFTPVPIDRYLCRLSEIVERSTKNGDELWSLKWEIITGKYQGRFIFDNLVFSETALKRVKLVCSRLGLDVSGEINLTPDLLTGRQAYLNIEIEQYESEKDGKTKSRNTVPFAGYEHYGGGEETAVAAGVQEDDSEGNLPF